MLKEPLASSEDALEKPECRVLQVFSNLGVGGAETWLIALLRYFREFESDLPVRMNIHIFLTHGIKSDLDNEAEALGATLHYSKYTRKTLPSFVRDWRRVLRQYDFHAIHDHQENTAGMHFAMGLGHLPPVRIAHVHNPMLHLDNYSSSFLRRFTLWLGQDLISKLATHLTGTSRQLIEEQGFLRSKFSKLVRTPVHCGFDVLRFAGNHEEEFRSLCEEFGWTSDCKIVLFVGRLDSHEEDSLNQKNPSFAIEIAKICAQRNPQFRFLMAGSGEVVRKRLEERVNSWGLGDQIQLVGRRADVPRLMLGSHLFLLTSISEGLGMVVVEAQAAGLPSVVSDATPRECAVESSMVNFLPLAEGSDAWADSVLSMINRSRPDCAEGNSAVQNSGFSIQNSAQKILEFYTCGLKG